MSLDAQERKGIAFQDILHGCLGDAWQTTGADDVVDMAQTCDGIRRHGERVIRTKQQLVRDAILLGQYKEIIERLRPSGAALLKVVPAWNMIGMPLAWQ
jgi:hypothetical protein